jgi:hypothetical protein
VRLGEVGNDDFVDALARLFVWVRATRFDEFTKNRPARFEVMTQAQQRFANSSRFWTGKAHNPDPPATGRRGDGDDSVVKIHLVIL